MRVEHTLLDAVALQELVNDGELLHFANIPAPLTDDSTGVLLYKKNKLFMEFLQEKYGVMQAFLGHALDEETGVVDTRPDKMGAYVVAATFNAVHSFE